MQNGIPRAQILAAFACKEVEKLVLKNRLEDSHVYNHELSQIFDLRNHEDLTAYYNKKAIDFYLAMGFVTIRQEVNDIGKGYVMDDDVMELAL